MDAVFVSTAGPSGPKGKGITMENLISEAKRNLSADLGQLGISLDSWAQDAIHTLLVTYLTRAFQEGQAFILKRELEILKLELHD